MASSNEKQELSPFKKLYKGDNKTTSLIHQA